MSIDNPETQFLVVKNNQQQYSIWPTFRALPEGWQAIGIEGDKATCLAHINQEWTDMRPKSLQDAMA
ncbi:MbtH family protein [Motilimonas pumila]|uniref:MbtH family protein n=1 Tax=Motilimonas pumila TaxID=2303987 RepID=A0A418Y9Q0_9GAMM|nr:MbtH family NRPS accessory protein [Motilimonas pumila]RJG37980.1 MbtH family protein [Motilimonas pumila]